MFSTIKPIITNKYETNSKVHCANDLKSLFNSQGFTVANREALKTTGDIIEVLRLNDDYITALFATKANPESICLFTPEIQEKFKNQTSIFKNITVLTKDSDSDNETISLNNEALVSPSSSPVSMLSLDNEETTHLALLNNGEEINQPAVIIDLPINVTTSIKIESVAAPIVKISQRSPLEIRNEKNLTDDSYINALVQLALECKEILFKQEILNSFSQAQLPIAIKILENPNEQLSVLLKTAQVSGGTNSKVWTKIITDNIKMQPEFTSFIKQEKSNDAFLKSIKKTNASRPEVNLLDILSKKFREDDLNDQEL